MITSTQSPRCDIAAYSSVHQKYYRQAEDINIRPRVPRGSRAEERMLGWYRQSCIYTNPILVSQERSALRNDTVRRFRARNDSK